MNTYSICQSFPIQRDTHKAISPMFFPTNVLRYTVCINTDDYLLLSFTMEPSQPQRSLQGEAPKGHDKSIPNMSSGKHFTIITGADLGFPEGRG